MTDTSKMSVAVIGAGPGGYTAAFLAADLGMSVTLINLAPLPGGVCLHRGCIPSKALLHVAKLINESRHAKTWGVDCNTSVDVNRLRSFKEGVVKNSAADSRSSEKCGKWNIFRDAPPLKTRTR